MEKVFNNVEENKDEEWYYKNEVVLYKYTEHIKIIILFLYLLLKLLYNFNGTYKNNNIIFMSLVKIISYNIHI